MLNFLKEKKPDNLDSPETTLFHREIVLRKKFLKKLYIDWYSQFLTIIPQLPEGKIIEIGSGGGFIKELNKQILTSDILPFEHCDYTFSAENMRFDNNSISAIFMMDVLHHLPNSEKFFAEAKRVLKSGGIILMLEPANTWFSRLIFKNLHHEPFHEHAKEWEFPSSGPLSGANIALPWIIFNRDKHRFIEKFPEFKIKQIRLHTPFRYLITGGLSYKSLVPGWSFKIVTFFEKLFTPLYPILAMFQTIKVVKE